MSSDIDGYDVKAAPRSTLEEDLHVVREQLLPRLQQLEEENAALQRQEAAPTGPPQQPHDSGYDIKTAPRELLEEDLQIVREHLLPRLQQQEAENAALKAQEQQQQQQEAGQQ